MFRQLIAASLCLVALLPTAAAAPVHPRRVPATRKVAHIVGEINRQSEYAFEMEMLDTSDIRGERLIIIDSPGGEVQAGSEMVAAIEREQAHGVRVVCMVVHEASSMAFNILTHCDSRLATPTAHMLVHKVAIYGTPDGMRLTAAELRHIADNLDMADAPYRRANAQAMRLSLKDYDLFADKETVWSARTLFEMGYLNGIVTE